MVDNLGSWENRLSNNKNEILRFENSYFIRHVCINEFPSSDIVGAYKLSGACVRGLRIKNLKNRH